MCSCVASPDVCSMAAGGARGDAAGKGGGMQVLGLKPGHRVIDVGCGVGGPMRTVASTSGARVTGLTINDYQVSRATYHNSKVRGPPPPPFHT